MVHFIDGYSCAAIARLVGVEASVAWHRVDAALAKMPDGARDLMLRSAEFMRGKRR